MVLPIIKIDNSDISSLSEIESQINEIKSTFEQVESSLQDLKKLSHSLDQFSKAIEQKYNKQYNHHNPSISYNDSESLIKDIEAMELFRPKIQLEESDRLREEKRQNDRVKHRSWFSRKY